jgi:hypothetical protein
MERKILRLLRIALIGALGLGIWAATEFTDASKASQVKTLRYANAGLAAGIMAITLLTTLALHSKAVGGFGGSFLIVLIAALLVRILPPKRPIVDGSSDEGSNSSSPVATKSRTL